MVKYIKITFCNKTKSLGELPRLFGVDPAGLAPAYPSGNNGMLLYTSRARIHEGNSGIEKALFQGPFLYHSGLSVILRNIPLLLSVYHSRYPHVKFRKSLKIARDSEPH